MIREATIDDTERILDYVKEHVSDCMYLYIDIKKYGLGDEHLKAWVDEDKNGISLAMMKYHTGIVLYTDRDDWDVEGVKEIIEQEKPNSLTARRDLVEKLHEVLADEYDADYGYVFILTKYPPVESDVPIEPAKEDDFKEIAYLVTSDEGVGNHYDVEDYARQLSERMNEGFGRSYIIRKDGKIVGHIASYAECDGIAPISGLIVDPEYRDSLYGAALEKKIMDDLREEGFTVYSTVTTRLRKKLLEVSGNECKGEYGKLVLKH